MSRTKPRISTADAQYIQIEELLTLARHLEIAHHVPGRIRLRILASGFVKVQAFDIAGIVLGIPGVIGMRTNAAARSVIIEYNQAQLPFDLWQKLGQIKQQPERTEEVACCLRALLES
jgi:hypothetical protein